MERGFVSNPKHPGTTYNVFVIHVGVSTNLFVAEAMTWACPAS
jgi:hypothetical protein